MAGMDRKARRTKNRDAKRKGNRKSPVPVASQVGFSSHEKGKNGLCILNINPLSGSRLKTQERQTRIGRILLCPSPSVQPFTLLSRSHNNKNDWGRGEIGSKKVSQKEKLRTFERRGEVPLFVVRMEFFCPLPAGLKTGATSPGSMWGYHERFDGFLNLFPALENCSRSIYEAFEQVLPEIVSTLVATPILG